jgi:hypothetical protein
VSVLFEMEALHASHRAGRPDASNGLPQHTLLTASNKRPLCDNLSCTIVGKGALHDLNKNPLTSTRTAFEWNDNNTQELCYFLETGSRKSL